MYGKFFASTFTGSMLGSGPTVFAVWGYVIANTVGSQVELNPALLSHVIGASVEEIEAALAALCAPDPKSRSKVEEGRRLVREGEYAYRVPNYEAYHAVRNEEDRRAYNREKQREHRKRVRASVNDSQSLSALSAKEEAETEEKKTQKKSGTAEPPAPPADQQVQTPQGQVTFPKEGAQLIRHFYGGNPARAADAGKQLLAALGAGAKLEKGVFVRAHDTEHLRWACKAVLADPPDKPELAARFVLLKLRDTFLEVKARHERVTRATEASAREDLLAEAQRYVDGIGGLWDLIESEVDAMLEPAQRGKPSPSRNIMLEAAVLDAFERQRALGDGSVSASRRAPGASIAGPPSPPTQEWQPAQPDSGRKTEIPADLLEEE